MKKFNLTLILTLAMVLGAMAQEPERLQLKGIILTGTQGNFYTISNKLTGVYVPPRFKNVLFAKDNNANVNKSEPTEDQIASDKIFDAVDQFDQSNWVKILFHQGFDATQYEGREINNYQVTGRVNVASAPAGPVGLYVDMTDATGESPLALTNNYPEYQPNTYCTANFVVQPEWFLVKPKNLEFAVVRWAIYQGNGQFVVPAKNGDVNGYNLSGSFPVDMTLWEQQTDDNSVTADDVFTVGENYEFYAIIGFSTGNKVGLNIDPGFDGDFIVTGDGAPRHIAGGNPGTLPEEYTVMVYPLRESHTVITAVDDVRSSTRTVASVRYTDAQGRTSTQPHHGFNVVTTTYTDGTTAAEKRIIGE